MLEQGKFVKTYF
jgi:hypothetical protein